MNGQSSQRRSQTCEGWNRCGFRTGTVRGQWSDIISINKGLERRSGPKPSAGQEDESPAGSMSCQPRSDQMEWVASSPKKLASRFYQLKMDHCLTGQYLQWPRKQPIAKRWWCPYRNQTREHVFKTASAGRPSKRNCGQRLGRRLGREDRFGYRTSWLMLDASRQYWTSSPPPGWRGWEDAQSEASE